MYSQRIGKLMDLEKKPYFGSFSFTEDGKNNKMFRIGKTDLSENNEQIILDWRNRICSLYYDSNLGRVSYNAPVGTINGELTNKKQIIIEDGELLSMRDVDLVSDDELLQPYLDIHAENKMKTIIASIQREQNEIIRKDILKNLIVQGVAGSGKTSVALHRIAYLIYNNKKSIEPNKFVIIGPNKFFLDYISSVLPDLDTTEVSEFTFEELSRSIINEEGYYYENSSEELERTMKKNVEYSNIKGSIKYKEYLHKFLEDYFDDNLSEGIYFEDTEIISKEFLKKGINVKMGYCKAITDFVQITIKKLKEHFEDMYYDIVEPMMQEMKQYPLKSEERNAVIKRMDVLKEKLKKGYSVELRKLIKPLLVSPVSLYKIFLQNIEKYVPDFNGDYDYLKNESLNMLKKKIIPYDDMAAIDYLSLLYYGVGEFEKYKHVVIDEAQDYTMFQFQILSILFSKATFSIYGDLAQSIYYYRSIHSWESLNDEVFKNKFEIINLLKSYRNTLNITRFSNHVLRQMGLNEAIPVVRLGDNVRILKKYGNEIYSKLISEYILKGYKSIGIICKNNIEMENIKNIFEELQLNYNYITIDDLKYSSGTSILTSYSAKGLEFDAVLINNASKREYDVNSNIDMHLLYVSLTRALHQLDVLYEDEITEVLENTEEYLNSKKLLINN